MRLDGPVPSYEAPPGDLPVADDAHTDAAEVSCPAQPVRRMFRGTRIRQVFIESHIMRLSANRPFG
jgi:hypothetical protein